MGRSLLVTIHDCAVFFEHGESTGISSDDEPSTSSGHDDMYRVFAFQDERFPLSSGGRIVHGVGFGDIRCLLSCGVVRS